MRSKGFFLFELLNVLNELEPLALLTFDIFEMDRSSRRGGENSARFDFSTRREISDGIVDGVGFFSSCVGLKKRARFDVSRVAVGNFGTAGTNLLALFFSDPGVLRPMNDLMIENDIFIEIMEIATFLYWKLNKIPGVRRFASPRRFGVDTFSLRLNFLWNMNRKM